MTLTRSLEHLIKEFVSRVLLVVKVLSYSDLETSSLSVNNFLRIQFLIDKLTVK